MRLRLLLIAFLSSVFSWGQAVLPIARTIWDSTPVGWTDSGTSSYLTPFACSGDNAGQLNSSGDSYVIFFTGIPNQLTFQLKGAGFSGGMFLIEESQDGVIWSTIFTYTVIGGSCSPESYVLSNTTRYVRFNYLSKVTGNISIDDVGITLGSPTPLITATPNLLTGFNYIVGSGPSNEQTFTASGSSLTNDITISAPVNYEISTTSGVGFTNNIILPQSGGNVPAVTIYVRLKAGLIVNVYNEIISVASIGAVTQNVTCNGSVVNTITAFEAGDFAVISLNSNISCYPAGPNGPYGAGDDEISFITFRDIQNGDSFHITDNGYERASVGLWGNSEGLYKFTRTGATIPAGTVITFRLLNASPFVEFNSPDTNWTFVKETGFSGSLVMNSGGDQIFFTQGGFWNNPGGTHDATYTSGNYLYAFNTNSTWTSLGTSTQQSALPFVLSCFSLMPGSATDYLEYTGPTTAAAKLDWVARLNNPSNWTDRANCVSYVGTHVGQSYSVTAGGTYVDGVWIGSKDSDWFDCSNWQTLKVPNETVNVDINSTYAVRDALIDVTSINAPIYGNIAKANNLTISSNKVQIEANSNNKLEVHGNLLIDGTGVLDMDDSNTATVDGQIYLFGNWTNNNGVTAFDEGNGTIHFNGTSPQIINNVTPVGTEEFYNVVLNNDFTTSISNNLIATGNLIVNSGKTIVVSADDYIQVNNDFTNNGTFTVLNNGSLIQVDDFGVNTGAISYERTTTGNALDYVYWSSPVDGVNTPASGYIFTWDSDYANPNTGWGYWLNARNTTMLAGVGYIMRDVFSKTFTGVARNGVIQPTVSRANYTGADFTGTNSTTITKFDDNWNLIGNPYPSAVDALEFLTLNTNIEGAVRLWTHDTSPSTVITDPFYGDYVANYTVNDYITHNGTGTVSGPGGFNGYIAGGQSFFVNMLDGSAATQSITFNNSLRNKGYNNSQFYKQTEPNRDLASQKSRIWLDIVDSNNTSDRTLVGYVEGATYGNDRMYDAVTNVLSGMKIYTIINNNRMTINGRSLPFENQDKIQLGIKTTTGGMFSIAISAVDGLFVDETQDIFLEDKVLNIIHDLRHSAYSFYMAEKGELNDRFVLRYTNERLTNEDVSTNENNVMIASGNVLEVISSTANLQEIVVYDVLGRKIFSKNNINSKNIELYQIRKSNNTLFINVTLENNITLIKKVVF